MKRYLVLLVFVLAVCLLPLPVLGQAGSSARLTGQISDQSGAVMPKVQLDLEDLGTGTHRTTVSNDEGYFTIDVLHPGTYQLTVTAPG
ncbi:MAG: carboxypeptidase-like regulatory domain-containing protein, partial [Bryobacteraceae bacterium]